MNMSIQMGKKYQDKMDESRCVSPVEMRADGKNVKCKVYFDGRFSGYADCPISLFNTGIGFQPVFDAALTAGG